VIVDEARSRVWRERRYRLSVSGKAPNYIWRKLASDSWLRKHELALSEQTCGTYAVVERPGNFRIALEVFCKSSIEAGPLLKRFGGTLKHLAGGWEMYLAASSKTKPLRIGRRLTIFSEPESADRTPGLFIPAGAAFGTGEHATTAMSLRLLERVSRRLVPGWRMLDAGTGTGILALAGQRFGAREIVAIDNDRTAIRTARENARCNKVRGVKFIVGDIKNVPAGRFNIITANLYSDLLTSVLPLFRRSLAKDGQLILSGILRVQEAPLTRALKAKGFHAKEARRRGKWVALLAIQRAKT
jgi:ribosomal protein L11 methyltransferase